METEYRYTNVSMAKIKNIFLTGDMNIGKTTILKKVINRVDGLYGGYMGYSEIDSGHKYIKATSLNNLAEDYLLAKIDCSKRKSICVNEEAFNKLGREIYDSVKNREIIVLDEIGIFEEKIELFKDAVMEAIQSDKLVLGVLKKKDSQFINHIKSRDDVIVIDVTLDNRDNLSYEILNYIKMLEYEVASDKYFSWDKFRVKMYDKCIGREMCDYPEIFIEKILGIVGKIEQKNVLDIGTGTGAFLYELMDRGANCTGIDISIHMLEQLKSKIRDVHMVNNTPRILLSSFRGFYESNLYDESEFDIVISAFSSSINKDVNTVEKALELAKKNLFILYHHPDDKEKFSERELSKFLNKDISKSKNKCTNNTLLKELDDRNIDYDYEVVEFDFPQYIDSIEEGINLFKIYFNIDSDDIPMVREFIKQKAISVDCGFIIPEKRKSVFLNIKK